MRIRARLFPALVLAAVAAPVLAVGTPAQAAIDVTAPTVQIDSAPRLVQGGVLTDSTATPGVPASISWRQFDTGSGICGTTTGSLLGYRSGYGWVSVGGNTQSGAVGTGTVAFTADRDAYSYYHLTVRTQDCAGNAATQTRYVYNPNVVQETSLRMGPGWATSACRCFSDYAVFKSTRVGASATYTYSGSNAIALVTNYAPDRGTADVYVDGRKKATINAQSATKTNRVIGYQTYFKGTSQHELKVVVTSGRFDIDAVITN